MKNMVGLTYNAKHDVLEEIIAKRCLNLGH